MNPAPPKPDAPPGPPAAAATLGRRLSRWGWQARRSIGVRLGLWSALIFALGVLGLLGLAYYRLASAADSKDREVLQARLREFAAVYDNGGLADLRRAIDTEEGGQKTLFVRVVSPWNHVAFVSVPAEWVTFHDLPSGLAGYRQRMASFASPTLRNGILSWPPPCSRMIPSCRSAAAATAAKRCWSRCGAALSWWAA